jgi:hypothetical protein
VEGGDAEVGRAVRALILHVTDGTPCVPLPGSVEIGAETAENRAETRRNRAARIEFDR